MQSLTRAQSGPTVHCGPSGSAAQGSPWYCSISTHGPVFQPTPRLILSDGWGLPAAEARLSGAGVDVEGTEDVEGDDWLRFEGCVEGGDGVSLLWNLSRK